MVEEDLHTGQPWLQVHLFYHTEYRHSYVHACTHMVLRETGRGREGERENMNDYQFPIRCELDLAVLNGCRLLLKSQLLRQAK